MEIDVASRLDYIQMRFMYDKWLHWENIRSGFEQW